MWRTRTGAGSGRLLRGVAEGAAQLSQRERLVEVRPAQPFEELQRIPAHRVPGGEDDPLGRARVLPGKPGVHVAPGEMRHAQVADDDVERFGQGTLQRVDAVARDLDGVAPA